MSVENVVQRARSGQYCLYYSNPLANHEIEHINGDRYIPSGIRAIAQDGHLSQEGSDNVLTLTQKQ